MVFSENKTVGNDGDITFNLLLFPSETFENVNGT